MSDVLLVAEMRGTVEGVGVPTAIVTSSGADMIASFFYCFTRLPFRTASLLPKTHEQANKHINNQPEEIVLKMAKNLINPTGRQFTLLLSGVRLRDAVVLLMAAESAPTRYVGVNEGAQVVSSAVGRLLRTPGQAVPLACTPVQQRDENNLEKVVSLVFCWETLHHVDPVSTTFLDIIRRRYVSGQEMGTQPVRPVGTVPSGRGASGRGNSRARPPVMPAGGISKPSGRGGRGTAAASAAAPATEKSVRSLRSAKFQSKLVQVQEAAVNAIMDDADQAVIVQPPYLVAYIEPHDLWRAGGIAVWVQVPFILDNSWRDQTQYVTFCHKLVCNSVRPDVQGGVYELLFSLTTPGQKSALIQSLVAGTSTTDSEESTSATPPRPSQGRFGRGAPTGAQGAPQRPNAARRGSHADSSLPSSPSGRSPASTPPSSPRPEPVSVAGSTGAGARAAAAMAPSANAGPPMANETDAGSPTSRSGVDAPSTPTGSAGVSPARTAGIASTLAPTGGAAAGVVLGPEAPTAAAGPAAGRVGDMQDEDCNGSNANATKGSIASLVPDACHTAPPLDGFACLSLHKHYVKMMGVTNAELGLQEDDTIVIRPIKRAPPSSFRLQTTFFSTMDLDTSPQSYKNDNTSDYIMAAFPAFPVRGAEAADLQLGQ